MKTRLKWLVATLLVTVFVSVQAQDIVIGWSGAVTGPTSDAGQYVIQGVQDYCQYANDENLIPEHTLKCLTSDDAYDNDNSLRNFEGFLDEGMMAYLSYATGATLATQSQRGRRGDSGDFLEPAHRRHRPARQRLQLFADYLV